LNTLIGAVLYLSIRGSEFIAHNVWDYEKFAE